MIDRDQSEQLDLETPFVWTDSSFQVLRVSRDVRLADFPHFLPNLRGQGACERKGDCNKEVAPISPSQEVTSAEKLTESEEGEESDDESRALHIERVEIERREKRVEAKRGETG